MRVATPATLRPPTLLSLARRAALTAFSRAFAGMCAILHPTAALSGRACLGHSSTFSPKPQGGKRGRRKRSELWLLPRRAWVKCRLKLPRRAPRREVGRRRVATVVVVSGVGLALPLAAGLQHQAHVLGAVRPMYSVLSVESKLSSPPAAPPKERERDQRLEGGGGRGAGGPAASCERPRPVAAWSGSPGRAPRWTFSTLPPAFR